MIMTYTGHIMTALGYIAGFIVLALFWIWLILVFAEAIAQLWRELVIQCRLSVSAFRVSSPARKRKPSRSPSSSDEVTHTPEQQRQAPMILYTSGEPSVAANTTALTTASTEVASDGVPLFVIDAPLFQADPDVFDARPADLLEILEDACSAAKAAGYSDEEIARMLADGSRFPRQRSR